jgi:hypothetical protein
MGVLLEESGHIFQMRPALGHRGLPANHFPHRLLHWLNFSFHEATLIRFAAPGQLESRTPPPDKMPSTGHFPRSLERWRG